MIKELIKDEIWKKSISLPNYEVSSLGRVRHVDRKIPRKLQDNGHGYMTVGVKENGKAKKYYAHRLVAEAFIPNPDNLAEINHKNQIRSCNIVENLEWCTRQYNLNYGDRGLNFAKARGFSVYQYSLDGELIEKYVSLRACSRAIKKDRRKIKEWCSNKMNVDGFVFTYEPLEEMKEVA